MTNEAQAWYNKKIMAHSEAITLPFKENEPPDQLAVDYLQLLAEDALEATECTQKWSYSIMPSPESTALKFWFSRSAHWIYQGGRLQKTPSPGYAETLEEYHAQKKDGCMLEVGFQIGNTGTASGQQEAFRLMTTDYGLVYARALNRYGKGDEPRSNQIGLAEDPMVSAEAGEGIMQFLGDIKRGVATAEEFEQDSLAYTRALQIGQNLLWGARSNLLSYTRGVQLTNNLSALCIEYGKPVLSVNASGSGTQGTSITFAKDPLLLDCVREGVTTAVNIIKDEDYDTLKDTRSLYYMKDGSLVHSNLLPEVAYDGPQHFAEYKAREEQRPATANDVAYFLSVARAQ